MIINKLLTPQEKEESSSLTNQKKFIRRPDITSEIRLNLAIAGLGKTYRDTTIAELCAKYDISHEFIYSLSRILRKESENLFWTNHLAEQTEVEKVLGSMRFYLEAKMQTQGSLYGLSNLGESWGIPYHSVNFISQALDVTGKLLDNTLESATPVLLTFLSDEVYSGGQPILVTLEAQSMAVLDIKLVGSTLSQQDWEQSWQRLSINNIAPEELLKDQGKAMQAAAERMLSEQTVILPDTFHAVAHRLGIFAARLARRADKAMEEEWNRKTYLDKAKTPQSQAKQQAKYEAAQIKTLKAIDELEWFEEHYFIIVQQLRPFTSEGAPRSKADAVVAVEQSLEALGLLPLTGLSKQLNHIEKLLEAGELFLFLDKVPGLYKQLGQIVDPDTLWVWTLNWQWWKKAMQTRSPKVRQYVKLQAEAATELLEEFYAGTGQSYEQLKMEVFVLLDKIVQASSLVETFNSILKPFINSARGQVSQSLLNLVMFYHNHRKFQRGKRKGKAPIELLKGTSLNKSWIDLLMDKVKAAFQQFGISSLKQLHQLTQQQHAASIRELETQPNTQHIAIAA